MSLLRPGVIKQHKPNQTNPPFHCNTPDIGNEEIIIMNDIMLHGSPCMVVNMSFRISRERRKRAGGWGEKFHISHILCQSQ